MLVAVSFIAGYLIGSFSSAIIVCRMLGLGDPRLSGSGNPGTTNVLRLGGKRAAALTLVGDVLKGTLPVAAVHQISGDPVVIAAVALACFLGHLYPLYYGFKGGKGVATAIGVYLGIDLILAGGVIAAWLGIAGVTRIASLSSLMSMLVAPGLAWTLAKDDPIILASIVIFLFVCATHTSNIKRLLAGEESKINL